MNPRLPKSILLPLAAGLVQILSSCMSSTVNDPDKSAGGSDEIDTRVAVDRTGKPVASARIALVRPNDSTGKPVAVSATGKDGSFPSFVVPDGFYSVVMRDSGETMGKYLDSVVVKSQKLPSGRDTLLAMGSIRGVVRVSTGHSPATVSMGLVGTDILATVKSDGTFRIELVPGGVYTLGAFPTLEGYGPLYLRIQLKDGQNLTLPDTLVMPFTGLASPGALRVLQDTGTGHVGLSWSPVDHPDLLGYVVDRVEGGAVTTSSYLTDTTWIDSLGAYWSSLSILGPWPSRSVAYRVRSRSLSGTPDSKSIAQAFTAKPPMWTNRVDSTQPILRQDTSTGDVRIHWSPVRHPHLSGYVVERLENGVTTSQRMLRDTSIVDSIGKYWNALPLLGPWPQRSLSYRIRLVAESVATNAVTAWTTFEARPPEWTNRVDSTNAILSQDTSTGNVRIHWKPVRHPHLLGYVVERTENGIAVSQRMQRDTIFADAVGEFWTGLPLFGPWPKRNLSYRIRLVADSTAFDAMTASTDFLAKPPEWTKHVDSVKVTMQTDSVTGVTTLRWNTLIHPDLAGWSVTRSVDGIPNCTEQPTEGQWSDGGCVDAVWKPVFVDSGNTPFLRLLASNKTTVSYSLSASRRSTSPERIGETARQLQPQSLATWRDSTTIEDLSKIQFAAFGGWISKRSTSDNSYALSKNGVDWENIPHSFEQIIGQGDSVWTVSLDPDSTHITVSSRVNAGTWNSRKIALSFALPVLGNLSVKDGNLVIGFHKGLYKKGLSYYSDTILELRGESFIGAKIGGFGPFMYSWNTYVSIPITKDLRVDQDYNPSGFSYLVVQSGEIRNRFDSWGFDGLTGVVGQDGGMIVFYKNDFAYLPVTGSAKLIPSPKATQRPFGPGQVFRSDVVFRDEIWTIIDGHLWKGKLNLPK